MLALINDGGGEDRDNDDIHLPASFPVEEVNQVWKSQCDAFMQESPLIFYERYRLYLCVENP